MLSGMLVQKDGMLRILARCRARGLRTVVGGPITSSMTDLPLYADHVVVGEAEEIVAGLAADLERGTAKPLYQAAELPGLDTTPLPDLDLINPKYYSAMAIQYSRGCPFNCEFCDIIEIYGRKPRTKSPDADGGRARTALRAQVARPGLHRGRQLHRQQAQSERAAAGDGANGTPGTAVRSPSTPKLR